MKTRINDHQQDSCISFPTYIHPKSTLEGDQQHPSQVSAQHRLAENPLCASLTRDVRWAKPGQIYDEGAVWQVEGTCTRSFPEIQSMALISHTPHPPTEQHRLHLWKEVQMGQFPRECCLFKSSIWTHFGFPLLFFNDFLENRRISAHVWLAEKW